MQFLRSSRHRSYQLAKSSVPIALALALAVCVMVAPSAAQNCSSAPASWGNTSAYESWCRSCGGTISGSGPRIQCTPGSNWGGRGSSSGSSAGSGMYGVGYSAGYQLGQALGRFLFGAPADPQAAIQRQQMLEELARRQAEAEQQRREAEARRLAEMYRRLQAGLKLSGLPSLQLKEVASNNPTLKLKLSDAPDGTAGIKGLPGIYLNDGKTPYGIRGLPGIYTGGPGEGSGLKLKMGDSADAAPAANQPAQQASAAEQKPESANPAGGPTESELRKMTPQQLADLAEHISNLPPEEQQQFFAGAENAAAASQAAAAAPVLEDASMKARTGFDTPATGVAPPAAVPPVPSAGVQQPVAAAPAEAVPRAPSAPVAQPQPTTASAAAAAPSTSASQGVPVLGTVVIPQASEPTHVAAKGTMEVPVPRPEGWVADANKGKQTLAYVATRGEAANRPGCARQAELLADLRLFGGQLAQTEKLINDIDRRAPARFAEFKKLDEGLRADKQQFIDQSISALSSATFSMHNQLHRGTLQSTAEGVEILKSWQRKVSEWNERLENLKKVRSLNRSEEIQGVLELSSDMAEQVKDVEELPGSEYLKDVFKSVGMAKKVKDVTDVALGFGKLEVISDYRVSTVNEQAEADLKARAVLLPLQRRLSDKIDTIRRNPALSGACN